MRKQRSQCPNGFSASLLLLLAGLLLPFDGKAAAYTYTLIADTSDRFIALDRAVINDRGSVAFLGNRGPLDGNSNSVFVGNGRSITAVALVLDPNVGSINSSSGPSAIVSYLRSTNHLKGHGIQVAQHGRTIAN